MPPLLQILIFVVGVGFIVWWVLGLIFEHHTLWLWISRAVVILLGVLALCDLMSLAL